MMDQPQQPQRPAANTSECGFPLEGFEMVMRWNLDVGDYTDALRYAYNASQLRNSHYHSPTTIPAETGHGGPATVVKE
jgi:hypothetical protein